MSVRAVIAFRLAAVAALVFVAASAPPVLAAVSRVGSEFQVNTYTTSDQFYPAVAMSPTGEFVVVWSSISQDGDSYGNFGQRFESTGMPSGAEFQINTYTTSYQTRPSIVMDGSGGFVVVWTSYEQDGDSFGVFGRRFDSAGDPLGGEFQANTFTTFDQYRPAVSANTSGDFVIVWVSGIQDGSLRGIFAQRFDSGGMQADAEFQVNTFTTGVQRFPAVSMDDSGAFIVAWESHGQEGSQGGIFAQRFDSNGMRSGAEFQVNSFTTGNQVYAAIATVPGGDFMVVWQSPKTGNSEITGQRYAGGGQPLGAEFRIADSVPYAQFEPTVAGEESGGFVVVWGESFSDGSGTGIVGRRIGASGSPVSGDFQVNTYTTGTQRLSVAGMNGAGDLVVAWQGESQDGASYGVFGQRFRGRAPGLTSHTSGDLLDCSDPAVARPTFTWDPDGYDRFRVYLSSDPGFGKGTFVTSGDGLRPGTSWEPSAKKWRKACTKAIAANPINPEMFIRVLGKDTDLGKNDRARLLFSEAVVGDVQP